MCLQTAQAEPVPCDYNIKGKVSDEHDNSALDYSTIFIVELEKGVVADSAGYFEIKGICPGQYTFRISHLGCDNKDTVITVRYPMAFLEFKLEHHAEELAAVQITAQRISPVNATDISQSVQQSDLRNPSLELGQLLKNITGVQNLQTGPTLFKPIIHGLHSDRVLIVNNGMRLEGQSWGSEHAPEMDASAARELQVIKGAGSVQFGTDAIGGVVLMEYDKPEFNKVWKAQVNTSYQSNNRGGALHARLGNGYTLKNNHQLGFQIGGSAKRFGDARAPDYVLSNTGAKEFNGYAGLFYQKRTDDKIWQWQSLYSIYNRETGILAASHVGNLTDLQTAISTGEPQIVREWTYEIGLPKQSVLHHSLKNKLEYQFGKNQFRLQYDVQIDHRKEFDNRRGNRSDIPALDMDLLVHHVGAVYKRSFLRHQFNAGADYYYKYNRNVPGTGFRVIVPDYVSQIAAIWMFDQWKINQKLTLEGGGRYEYQYFSVFRFNEQKELIKPTFKYNNLALLGGISWDISEKLQWKSTLGIASRSPNANELFSQGVHQSAAAIEYGDTSLLPEKSFKWIHQLSFNWNFDTRLVFSPYANYVNNFIYLEPQQEFELTVRGPFPVFRYRQTDVIISGLDVDFSFKPGVEWLKLGTQYSYIRMIKLDESRDELVNTPPNRITLSAGLHKLSWKSFQNLHAGFEWTYVAQQQRVDPRSDFASPPDAYNLLSMEIQGETIIGTHRLGAGVTIDNMLNTRYRDYLDRFRYFADAQGINVHAKIYFII